MSTDPLRDRIARTDPVEGADISPVSSESSQRLLEDIMNTPIHDSIDDQIHTPATPTTAPSGRPSGGNRSARRLQWLAGAAAVAAIAFGGAAIGGVFDNGDGDGDIAAPDKLTVLDLSTGDVDPTMMMCMELNSELVAQSPLAFQGTATMVENDIVTLLVDTWYVGGDAGQVTLTAPSGMEALIGGIAFETGKQYIVSAVDGVVSYCGMTGEATPELEALYDAAFPG